MGREDDLRQIRAQKEFEEGQKDGSTASNAREMMHDTIGQTQHTPEYNAGFANGVKNKAEKKT